MDDLEKIAKLSVDCGFRLHKKLGPGLHESVYQLLLFESLKDKVFLLKDRRSFPLFTKAKSLTPRFVLI